MRNTNPHPWTPEDEALLRQAYATTPVAQLAEQFSTTPVAIYARAKKLGLKRPTNTVRRNVGVSTGLNQTLRTLAARPNGVSGSEVAGFARNTVARALYKLYDKGELHRVHLGHKWVRFFADAAAAQACAHAPWPADAEPVHTAATKYTYAAPPPARPLRTNTHAIS